MLLTLSWAVLTWLGLLCAVLLLHPAGILAALGLLGAWALAFILGTFPVQAYLTRRNKVE